MLCWFRCCLRCGFCNSDCLVLFFKSMLCWRCCYARCGFFKSMLCWFGCCLLVVAFSNQCWPLALVSGWWPFMPYLKGKECLLACSCESSRRAEKPNRPIFHRAPDARWLKLLKAQTSGNHALVSMNRLRVLRAGVWERRGGCNALP